MDLCKNALKKISSSGTANGFYAKKTDHNERITK
jgi:hypothetical protein